MEETTPTSPLINEKIEPKSLYNQYMIIGKNNSIDFLDDIQQNKVEGK